VSDAPQEWRWVGEDGVEKTVTEQDLIAELSSESLANYTFVWKKGWLEWLPAMQVAELAWALPAGKADEPTKPKEKDTAASPPAPPLYRYPVVKRRAANLRLDKPAPDRAPLAPRPSPRKDAAATQPAPVAAPAVAPPTAAAALPLAAPAATKPERTEPEGAKTEPRPIAPPPPAPSEPPIAGDSKPFEEVDIDSIEASNPLASHRSDPGGLAGAHPAGLDADDASDPEATIEEDSSPHGFTAPEPARAAFRARAYGEEDDAETRVLGSKPPGPLYVGPHAPPQSERPPPSYEDPDDELPPMPAPRPPPADLAAYAGISGASGGASAAKPRPIATYALGGLAAVLAIAVVVLLNRTPEAVAPAPAAAPSATAAPSAAGSAGKPVASAAAHIAPRPSGKPCSVVTVATRMADWADPGIAPAFAAIPGSQRVVVGFAQSDTYAIGITVDPRTLDRDQVFREARKQKVVSVVPTASRGKLHFQVVREDFALSNARGVDAPTPFFVGATPAAIAVVVEDRQPSPLWSFPLASESTVPRITTVPGVGHAVTFRRGGKAGHVTTGWLDPSGAKKTELVDIRADADFAGTPAIAASATEILVAFASRTASGPSWSLALASAKVGELPKTATHFTLPPGGPGGDGMSPSVGALTGGRWLLQWTEGSSGNRVARAQVLAGDLTALSEPVNLSPDGANAGQGAVWTNGDLGTILFYVHNDKKSHELWGTSVECPK
jgi:hypothetical protein